VWPWRGSLNGHSTFRPRHLVSELRDQDTRRAVENAHGAGSARRRSIVLNLNLQSVVRPEKGTAGSSDPIALKRRHRRCR
jgi:hypothetical protein